MQEPNADIWTRMYEEQVRHGRHHETLRSQSTNLIVALSGAALAFVAADGSAAPDKRILGLFMIVINFYGALLSLKHYERSLQHVAVGASYRRVVSEAAPLTGRTLNEVRREAKANHRLQFRFMNRIRVYALWSGLHVVLAVLGLWVLAFR